MSNSTKPAIGQAGQSHEEVMCWIQIITIFLLWNVASQACLGRLEWGEPMLLDHLVEAGSGAYSEQLRSKNGMYLITRAPPPPPTYL